MSRTMRAGWSDKRPTKAGAYWNRRTKWTLAPFDDEFRVLVLIEGRNDMLNTIKAQLEAHRETR